MAFTPGRRFSPFSPHAPLGPGGSGAFWQDAGTHDGGSAEPREQLLGGDHHDPEGQVAGGFDGSAHADVAPAMGVFRVRVDALHRTAFAVANRFGWSELALLAAARVVVDESAVSRFVPTSCCTWRQAIDRFMRVPLERSRCLCYTIGQWRGVAHLSRPESPTLRKASYDQERDGRRSPT